MFVSVFEFVCVCLFVCFVCRGACGTDDVRPLSVSLTDCAEIPERETPARQQRRRR